MPAGTDDAAREAAAFVEATLRAIPRLEELLRALLDGVAKGFAAVELIWGYDRAGHIVPADWVPHPQEWFALSPAGELLLLAPPFRRPEGRRAEAAPSAPGRSTMPAREAFPAPDRKFLLLRFGADHRNPYGRGLCQRLYWYYWFKKNTLKFWAIFNEKYGAPTAVATYGPGTPADDRQRMREVLEELQTGSSVVIPESVQLRLLETARSSDGGSYREFLDWCNDEMSKVVLGATLTSSEGRRSGSLALGSIHELVRQDYIEADARLLESVLNATLIPWLCAANLGEAVAPPRLMVETQAPSDLAADIRVDRELLSLGVQLPLAYFHEKYGRPAPAAAEASLRFDDANFYQYHLQFGVLTVNEVRARLGLPAVPWGSRRTADPGAKVESVQGSAEDSGRQVN